MPFHRIQEWKDGFFHTVTLKSLGFWIQLGHRPGEKCRHPKSAFDDDFIIINTHGIHEDRYSTFLKIMHKWRNLRSLKCAGCGHDPAGVGATQEGELVLLCPACLHPGKNLPDGWETSNQHVFLAIDANFCLKHRAISTNSKDPGLSNGWGYFIDERRYKDYLVNSSAVIQERSTCVSHNAVNMADTKSSKGFAATGIGTVDYACYGMKLANGEGDLQNTYYSDLSPYNMRERMCIISHMIWASRPWAHDKNILDYDGWAGRQIIPDGGGWAHAGDI
ncbi:uncharacterized protein F5891DRAFT_1197915 [Suillus fuscotomentosus]|uniref:CxC2-like cysteine cluster KDZ transposase-associated domain-containing protein n=1 Tax=Suillus fuscotomentosus TaxID=1912939 RepID=A0AAD4DR82_9AGAM|nr:uncharacterized protein F5891DRAFT_1197915 [Suillus fuscotomentosus]KAG1890639.1 hypothetical protein F5891DRAFT_1197915 [Suillus fuscotomentosus]